MPIDKWFPQGIVTGGGGEGAADIQEQNRRPVSLYGGKNVVHMYLRHTSVKVKTSYPNYCTKNEGHAWDLLNAPDGVLPARVTGQTGRGPEGTRDTVTSWTGNPTPVIHACLQSTTAFFSLFYAKRFRTEGVVEKEKVFSIAYFVFN